MGRRYTSRMTIFLKNLTAEQLHAVVAGLGVTPRLARRIQTAAVRRDEYPAADSGVPAAAVARVRQATRLFRLETLDKVVSPHDGFARYMFRGDGPSRSRWCAIPLLHRPDGRSPLCASAPGELHIGMPFLLHVRMGFVRDLAPWEMVDQVLRVRADSPLPVRGVVFMGYGRADVELRRPAANHPRAFRTDGAAIEGAKTITVSTAGVVSGIRRFTALRGDSAKVEGTGVRVAVPGGELVGEVLSGGSTHRGWERAADGCSVHFPPLKAIGPCTSSTPAPGVQRPGPRGEWAVSNDRSDWAITAGEYVFRLWLPPWRCLPGEIAAEKANGAALFLRRPLPAGILPHSAEGVRLWNGGIRRTAADSGRGGTPADPQASWSSWSKTARSSLARRSNLAAGQHQRHLPRQQGFHGHRLGHRPHGAGPCRRQGEAGQGQCAVGPGRRARRATAAASALPLDLRPRLLPRRRGQNAAAYVETLRKLSKPGTRVLILAGNANEPQHYGPPRVKEADIRRDFARGFEIERLEETRFDTTDPNRQGALAWRILLRRKE